MRSPSILVIHNPTSGRGRSVGKLNDVQARLDAAGATWVRTEGPGHATELARTATADVLVAAGGDGTVSEVVAGAIGRDRRIGILPLGTGNDLARTLGFGINVSLATDAILGGTDLPMDVYRWSAKDRTGLGVNIAGCGFDAVVADRINTGYRWLRGPQAYVAAVVESLGKFRPAEVEVVVDGECHAMTAMLVAVANAQSYGGGMRVAPMASLNDGMLDIVVVQGLSRMAFLRAFPQVFRGTHIDHPRVCTFRGRHVEVRSRSPLPVLADGELVGETPVTFDLLPRAITVRAPRSLP